MVMSCGFEPSEIASPGCSISLDEPKWLIGKGLTPNGPLTGPSFDRTTRTDQGECFLQ